MINFRKTVSAFKQELSSQRGVINNRFTYAARDWFAGLLICAALVIAAGTFISVQFVEYRNISSESVNVSKEEVKYNEVLVKRMITEYGQKYSQYQMEKQLYPPVVQTSSATGTEIEVEDNEVSSEGGPSLVQ